MGEGKDESWNMSVGLYQAKDFVKRTMGTQD
jgi:hypothetical protein